MCLLTLYLFIFVLDNAEAAGRDWTIYDRGGGQKAQSENKKEWIHTYKKCIIFSQTNR